MGKGENAGYQHFLLFPLCFQKASFSGSLKVGIVWIRVKDLGLSLQGIEPNINMNQKLKSDLGRSETIMGKEENAGFQQFLHLP